jgi:hypothetical protein
MDSGLFFCTHLYQTKKKSIREKEEKQKGAVTHGAKHIILSFLFCIYTQGSMKDSGRQRRRLCT